MLLNINCRCHFRHGHKPVILRLPHISGPWEGFLHSAEGTHKGLAQGACLNFIYCRLTLTSDHWSEYWEKSNQRAHSHKQLFPSSPFPLSPSQLAPWAVQLVTVLWQQLHPWLFPSSCFSIASLHLCILAFDSWAGGCHQHGAGDGCHPLDTPFKAAETLCTTRPLPEPSCRDTRCSTSHSFKLLQLNYCCCC